MFENMKRAAEAIGKIEWRKMLKYAADLHERCVNPAEGVFDHPWEEIGVGYVYRPAFGHWDIAHIVMDEAPYETEHAMYQILNDIKNQREDGFIPGSIYKRDGGFTWSEASGHAPMWIYAADEVYKYSKNRKFLENCLSALKKQISWFNNERRAENGGYFYLDILGDRQWESGVDEGVRFLNCGDSYGKKHACIDATAHVYGMLDICVKWSGILNMDCDEYEKILGRTRNEISALYDGKNKWFFDSWDIKKEDRKVEAFEGMFPLVCGAATDEQAKGVSDTLMDPNKFYTYHPIATVAADSVHFEKRMWRGPAWNSMTMWAVFGLLRYGFIDDARAMAEKALDASAKVFEETGEIWEFYDPLGGDPRNVARKPTTQRNMPCTDYMGHAPLFYLARVYDDLLDK